MNQFLLELSSSEDPVDLIMDTVRWLRHYTLAYVESGDDPSGGLALLNRWRSMLKENLEYWPEEEDDDDTTPAAL